MKSLGGPAILDRAAVPFLDEASCEGAAARRTNPGLYVALGQAWTKSAGSSGAGGFGIALGVPI